MEPATLFVPDYSGTGVSGESGAIRALIELIIEEGVLERIVQWPRINELPEWATDPKKREIGIIPQRPNLYHDYRYAVIVGKAGEVIVVRAGGRGDYYDYFIKPKKDAQPSSQPTPGS